MSSVTTRDVEAIVATIEANRRDPAMFLRSPSEVRENVSDFIVAKESDGRVIGCAAVHKHTTFVTEILSVSVLPGFQGRRVGQLLVEAALKKARAQGAVHSWLTTSKPGYFARLGFEPMSRWDLPVSVLLAKLRQVFTQPLARWLPALFGRFTFMEHRISREAE